MADISSITAALQARQDIAQNALSVQVVKQAAKADQALADMLAENAKTAQALDRAAQGGISIYA